MQNENDNSNTVMPKSPHKHVVKIGYQVKTPSLHHLTSYIEIFYRYNVCMIANNVDQMIGV